MQDGAPFRTVACLLCPVTWHGAPAMLKATAAPEELRGLDALSSWDGRGAVRVLHRAGGTTIMERAGSTLRAAEPDDAVRTTTLSAAVRELHAGSTPERGQFVALGDHLRALRHPADEQSRRAAELAQELLQRNADPVLLHGDVHAENLLASTRGWLFVDPKGIVGPRAFDYANIFTNWTLPEAIRDFDSRLAIVCREAALAERTVLEWIVVWSGVSRIWHLQDDHPEAAELPLATSALALERLR